jgi:hypothetical protein
MALRDTPMDDIKKRFRMSQKHVERDASYGRFVGLTSLHNPAAHPARFFFSGEALALLYVDDADALANIDAADLMARLGEPAARVRSRAGKAFTHNVYPQAGIAVSVHQGAAAYVEIFPPTTLQSYLDRLYVDPEAYTK